MTCTRNLPAVSVLLLAATAAGCSTQPDAGPVSQLAAMKPAPPPAVRTISGAQAWLDYYYAVANYSHHTQDWNALQELHAERCGQCDAIAAGDRLAGPGDIRRSPIVGAPAPKLSGDHVDLVTGVERIPPGSQRAAERFIDQLTLTWNPEAPGSWRVKHLSFEPYE